MKSLYAKRIAAVAASLLMGLAFAGQGVVYNNVPIINSAGQPVVQIVVGSTAQASDGVVAANIAAVIGSLAYTSTNVTATVNGRSAVSCEVTAETCGISNQQVWLGERGTAVASGSYSFSALIGSVLNNAVLNFNTITGSKTGQGSTTTSYAFQEEGTSPYLITNSPTVSPFTGVTVRSSVANPPQSPSATYNSGGVSLTGNSYPGSQFELQVYNSTTTLKYDNLVQLTSTQVPGLMNNAGNNGETESLWIMGFPVYSQNNTNFAILDANGAYQMTFNKPIKVYNAPGKVGSNMNRVGLDLLNGNWTLYNATPPTLSSTSVDSSHFVVGGNLTLAQSMSPLQTVYVGGNITSGAFKVVLNDLSYPNGTPALRV
jgi:hypothetical protein